MCATAHRCSVPYPCSIGDYRVVGYVSAPKYQGIRANESRVLRSGRISYPSATIGVPVSWDQPVSVVEVVHTRWRLSTIGFLWNYPHDSHPPSSLPCLPECANCLSHPPPTVSVTNGATSNTYRWTEIWIALSESSLNAASENLKTVTGTRTTCPSRSPCGR